MKNKINKNKSKVVIGVAIVLILAVIVFFVFQFGFNFSYKSKEGEVKKRINSQTSQVITKENLPVVLSGNEIIKNLPDNGVINLQIDDSFYSIKNSEIRNEKAEDSDISISIPSNYLSNMNQDFCGVLSKAYRNGDLKIEVHISKIEALFKYSSMIKYRECLGV